MRPKIAIFHSTIFEAPSLSELRQQFQKIGEVSYFPFLLDSPDHLKETAPFADIIVMNDVALTYDDLKDLPKLKLISLLGSGYDMIDLEGMKRGGVKVCNGPTYGIENVAQHAVAMIFELAHRIGSQNQQIAENCWEGARPNCIANFPIMELKGKTLGLVGYGNIAHRLTEMLAGFGMKFIASSSRSSEDLAVFNVAKVTQEQLFSRSDIVSLHARSTAENRHSINASLFQLMKPTSLLINTARGDLINEQDLASALINQQLAGAGLDVLTNEPPLPDCPLFQLPNCIHTPHIAWNSPDARERLTHETFENVRTFFSGEAKNQVN